ncbi:MAG: DUF1501 domain-containing protein [Bryobacteraceae bacterium]
MSTRRIFLKESALAVAGVGALPGWLARAAMAAENPSARKKILVAIFQRGAADGLNVVIPHAEKRYYEMRPSISVPKNQVVDLDGFFGLHPNLSPLKPVYDAGKLAFVHASGSPDITRSHFDAQDYMESGTPGNKGTRDGWLNRALPFSSGKLSPVRALSLGPALPRALRGSNPAVAVNRLSDFRVQSRDASDPFNSMYTQSKDRALSQPGKDTFEAIAMIDAIQKQTYTPANGASYSRGRLGDALQQVARLIKANVGLEVAFADIGGWDTHVNQSGAQPSQGPLANLLTEFGGAMAAFWQDLGDRAEDVVLVTMSEFGRTAKENGNRGTDHGHANCMFVMGGPVRGGKVYGKWPGLEQEQLYEGRDLALTTDFRDVLGELVARHLGTPNLGTVFPGYEAAAQKFHGLLV